MRKHSWLLVSLAVMCALLLNGCGKTEQDHTHNMVDDLNPILVELTVEPTEVQIGQQVKFEAKVTHQGKNVDDAKEVMFEFWKDGDSEDQHKKEIVQGAGDGKYVLEQIFEEAGTYHVISHVTAMDQHSMPSADFTVTE